MTVLAVTMPPARQAAASSYHSNVEALVRHTFSETGRHTMTSDGMITGPGEYDRAYINKPNGCATGRYIYYLENDSHVHYHISGTGPNGEYIPPHMVSSGSRHISYDKPTKPFVIQSESDMIRILDLRMASTSGSRTYFERPGFEGRYYLQRERDGSVSVFYEGGRHQSGVVLPPQTMVNGVWDLQRTTAIGTNPDSFVNARLPQRPTLAALPAWQTQRLARI